MERFFLNMRVGDKLEKDPEGSLCVSIAEAEKQAEYLVYFMAADYLRISQKLSLGCIEITDEQGNVLKLIDPKRLPLED